MTEEVVDVRCPVGWPRGDGTCHPGKLLMRLRMSGGAPSYVHPENWIVLNCDDCKRRLHKRGVKVTRVLHAYDFIGTLVTTWTEGTDPGTGDPD
jgi:hypothetical protein